MIKINDFKSKQTKWELGTTIYGEGELFLVQQVHGKYTLINLTDNTSYSPMCDSIEELQNRVGTPSDIIVNCTIDMVEA